MHAVESLFARCCEFFLSVPWCRITTSLESWHHWCIAIELLLWSVHHHLIDVESHHSPYKNPILFSRSSLCSWQHVLPLTKILLHMYLFSYKPNLRGGLPLWNMLLQCFHLLCIIGKKDIVCKHNSWFHHKISFHY
jgi:hypothetical protein